MPDGYNALKTFNMGQDDVIEEVKALNCGRVVLVLFGMAVYQTSGGGPKVCCCNADEGEPGTMRS